MKTNHTPGPWATSRDAVPEGHTQVTIYAEASGKRVATAFECDANAALIAAAPDMLALLDYLLVDMDAEPDEYPRWKDKIRAAIAKATKGT
jgi:hypothetical protein